MPKKKTGTRGRKAPLYKPFYKALRAEGIAKRKAVRVAGTVAAKLAKKSSSAAAPSPEPESTTQAGTPLQPTVLPTDTDTAATDAVIDAAPTDTAPSDGYEGWTKADLLAHARSVNLPGRATMSKGELLAALQASEHSGA